MKTIDSLYQQLIFSSDFESLKRSIDQLIDLGNFEAVNALNRYFHYASIKESRFYLISQLTRLNDFRHRYRFLTEISYQKDYDLKIAVLNAIYDLSHPAFAQRLFSIFLHTPHEEKKLIILKTLINSGVSLFVDEIVDCFFRESQRVQQYFLVYLVNIPFRSKETTFKIIDLIEEALNKTKNEIITGKLCNHLWLLSANEPSVLKKCYALFQKHKYGYSLFYRLFEGSFLEEGSTVTSKEIIRALEENDLSKLNQVRFSHEAMANLMPPLREKLLDIESKFTKEHHRLIWSLVRFNHLPLLDMLIDVFEIAKHYYFKQAILDAIMFMAIPDDRKDRLCQLCEGLLVSTGHSRIFETLSRTLIVLRPQMGLKKVDECFDMLEDGEQKASLLLGVYRALVDFGFGKSLTALDHYNLSMLVGSALDFISRKKNISKHLFQRTYRLVALLRLDTYEEELILLSKEDLFNIDLIKALLSMNKEKAFDHVVEAMALAQTDAEVPEVFFHEVIGELAHVSTKLIHRVPKKILLVLFETPAFTAGVFNLINHFRLVGYETKLPELGKSMLFHSRCHYLKYLGVRYMSQEETYLMELIRGSDEILIERSLRVLMFHANANQLVHCYNVLMKKKMLDSFLVRIEALNLHPEKMKEHLRALEKIKSKWPFESWKKVVSILSPGVFQMALMTLGKDESNSFKNEPIQLGLLLAKQEENDFQEAETAYTQLTRGVGVKERLGLQRLATGKYTNVLVSLFRQVIEKKWAILLENDPFKVALNQVFKRGIHVQDFLGRTPPWDTIMLDLDKLDQWIEIITTNQPNPPIVELQDIIHLFAFILHDNEFYSLSNPMGLPLELFSEHVVPERLARLESLSSQLLREENLTALNEYRKIFTKIINFIKVVIIP